MLETFWSLLPIPIGVFCIIYGILSGAEKDTQSADLLPVSLTSSDHDQTEPNAAGQEDQELKDLISPPDPQFQDPEVNRLKNQDILYYQILILGLGFGSIALGLDPFFPGLAHLSKIILLITLVTAMTLRLVCRRNETALDLQTPTLGLHANKKKKQLDASETKESTTDRNKP